MLSEEDQVITAMEFIILEFQAAGFFQGESFVLSLEMLIHVLLRFKLVIRHFLRRFVTLKLCLRLLLVLNSHLFAWLVTKVTHGRVVLFRVGDGIGDGCWIVSIRVAFSLYFILRQASLEHSRAQTRSRLVIALAGVGPATADRGPTPLVDQNRLLCGSIHGGDHGGCRLGLRNLTVTLKRHKLLLLVRRLEMFRP